VSDPAALHDCLLRFPGIALELDARGNVRASNGHLETLVGREVTGTAFAGLLDESSQGKWQRILAERDGSISACTWELVFTTSVTLELRKFLALWSTGEGDALLWLLEFSVDSRIESLYGELSELHRELVEAQRALGREKKQLAHALEEAERAVRSRDDVLAVVSHDLRNLLNTIVMSAGALELDLPEEARAEQLGVIRRGTTGMMRLMSDLVDVSAIEAGRFRVDPEPLDLPAVLAEVRQMFEADARARGLRLDSLIPADLPRVRADRDRLIQVLANIIGNALKFTPAGGSIAVRAAESGEAPAAIVVSVQDTGPGIAPTDLPNIFDRFWHTRRKRGGGAGLGLAISRGIVEAHGGRLWAESGEGARFSFTLPVALDRPSPA
jgi:signal transduction histidine kinase